MNMNSKISTLVLAVSVFAFVPSLNARACEKEGCPHHAEGKKAECKCKKAGKAKDAKKCEAKSCEQGDGEKHDESNPKTN